ncbi:MAG: rod shape-determining protein RodA [Alphaproteobacteria bacterium]|nr:rod shape-determining protein RodA [Alphaproteobacteria bacterium]
MTDEIHIKHDYRLTEKIAALNWGLIVLVCMVACVGFTALYSAGGGNFDPWASQQMMRFGMGFVMMLAVALVDIRIWYRAAAPLYAVTLLLLVIVEVKGHIGMGAQRWINLGFINLQPSEVMKIAVVLVLARYFHAAAPEDMKNPRFLFIPALLILIPMALVLIQPDLGTSLMIALAGSALFFMAGAPVRLFVGGIGATVASIPIVWHFLREYQKKRVLIFLDPESDPLGSGYHITQSKIALGSGGIEGKGFLEGSQSHLNFLPEKQTDFIFTLWAEEWGLSGGLFLMALFGLIFLYGLWISMRCRHNFGRYLALGLSVNFSLYVLTNIGMVMGLMPVVGIPLPLISYGGTVMLTVLAGFGLMMSCSIHKDGKVNRV